MSSRRAPILTPTQEAERRKQNADKSFYLLHRVFAQAARSHRRPDEGVTIYVTADMITEARKILGIEL